MKNIWGVAIFLFFSALLPRPVSASIINTNLNVQTGTNLRIVSTPTPTPTPTPSAVRLRAIATPTPTATQNIMPVNAVTSVVNLPIFATIEYPNGGEKIPLSDKRTEILFKYGGAFDMSVGGNYEHHLELWRNGQLLGNVDNFDYYPLNPYQSSVTFGWKTGQYFAVNPQYQTSGLKTAEAGDGYSIRVVITLGYADSGSGITKHKEIASDESDTAFTFLPKLPSIQVFTPEHYEAAITYPNGGEYVRLLERKDITFTYSGTFDEDQGGTYFYRIELWQNGTRLGNATSLGDFQIDLHAKSATIGIAPEYYWTEDNNTTKAVKIIPGQGYQYKVILEQVYTPEGGGNTQYRQLAGDMSDKPFTITAAAKNPISEALKQVTTPINAFFSKLIGFLKGGGGNVLPQ